MNRPVTHVFKNSLIVTDISSQMSQIEHRIFPIANTEKIVLQEGIIYFQYFSHFLFFLELTTFELHSDLEAEFINEKTRLFLFMMLQGKIAFSTHEGLPIISVEKNTCYATYNRKGRFHYTLPKGNHRFFYICPRTAWMGRNESFYPRIGQFLKSMKTDRKLFGHMSSCVINNNLHDLLTQLFTLKNSDQIQFESIILRTIKDIIHQYQILLDTKYSQRVYLIKEYIDKNYKEYIDNELLASHFFITIKTLIRTFRQEFGISPYSYIISVRMEYAKRLITIENLPLSQVYRLVGYSDIQSFRRQFKHYFGIPPSKSF